MFLRLHKVKGGTRELIINDSTTNEELYQFLNKISGNNFSQLQIHYIDNHGQNKSTYLNKNYTKYILEMYELDSVSFKKYIILSSGVLNILKKQNVNQITKLTLE
jgi:hypothetical protein